MNIEISGSAKEIADLLKELESRQLGDCKEAEQESARVACAKNNSKPSENYACRNPSVGQCLSAEFRGK